MVKFTLVSWLRSTVKQNLEGLIERPTHLKRQINAVFYVLSIMEQRVMFGLQQIFQEVLMEETCIAEPALLGTEIPAGEVDLGDRFISSIINWYMDFITKRLYLPLNQSSILYSPVRMAFVSKPGQAFRAENYCDLQELQALASIIGPYGVRLLDSYILRFLVSNISAVKESISAMASPLDEINSNFTKDARVLESMKRIKPTDLDAFVSRCIIIGNTLHFRGLLKEALGQAIAEAAPHAQSVITDAFIQAPWRNVSLQQHLLGINALAGDVGLNVGSADQYLKLALKKVVGEADQKLVRLLPVAFAISVYSTQWKEAQYIPNLESFHNSAHVLARCYYDLIEAMNIVSMPSGQDYFIILQQQMRHFLDLFTTLMLRMIRFDKKPPLDLPAVVLQADKFIGLCAFLTRDVLEQCIPYALLRSMAHDVYRAEHKNPEGW